MNKITQSLTLDLVEIRHNVINARQGDKLVRDLIITITNNGHTYPLPEHADVRLRGTRPDGNYVFYDGTTTVSDRANGIVHVQIPDYLLSSSGRAYLDIGIYQDVEGNKTEIASTEKFVLYIPEHIFSEKDAVHSPEGSTLSNLIQTTRELEKTVSENEEARQAGYSDMTNKISQMQSLVDAGKPVWEDKYTRNEVDNKFSSLETNIDWKESVGTFNDIAAAYPNPQDGWTVNVKDTDYTYRYNGTEWVTISANAIPKATASVDGLLSKEDKKGYDDANAKKHTHDNKDALDTVTSAQIAKWNRLDADMTGSTGDSDGVHGLVPAPPTSSVSLFLKNDGSWGIPDSSPQAKIDSIVFEESPLTQQLLLSQNASITKTKETELAPETEYTLFFAGAKVSSLRGFTQWKYEINIAVMETGSGETVVVQNLESISESGIRTAASKKSAERTFSTEGVLKPKLKIIYKWYREYPKTEISNTSYVKNSVTVKGLGNSFVWNGNNLSIDQGFQMDITGLEWDHLSLAFPSSDPDSLEGILYPYLLTNNGSTSNYKHGFEVSKSGNLITVYYRGLPLSATSASEFKFFFDDSYNTVVVSVTSPSYSASTSPYHLSLKYETTTSFSGSYNDLTDKPDIPAAVRIKGSAESTYRTGDVNLTSENIGALPKNGTAVSADKLDGFHASSFLGNGTGYVCPAVNGGNANDYKTEFHGFVFNMSNIPNQGSTNDEYSYGFLDISRFDGTGFQPATSGVIRQQFTTWKTAKEYVRTYQNGTWSSWRFVADHGGADSVFDYTNGNITRLNYGASCPSDFTYFAIWNGYELRAFNKENVANAIGAQKKRTYGTINPVHGTKNSASYVFKDADNHGHLHLYLTGVTISAGTWATIAASTIHPPYSNRGHVIVADGAYTLSGAERTGCTFNTDGKISIISPVSFTSKDVFVDVFW